MLPSKLPLFHCPLTIIFIHSCVHTICQNLFHRRGRKRNRLVHSLSLLVCETTQNMICQVPILWLCSHTDTNPYEILCPESGNNILDPIVPACTAFFPDSNLSRLQINIIVDDNQFLLRINLEIVRKAAHRLSTQIHICERFQQYDFLPRNHPFTIHSLAANSGLGNLMSLHQQVYGIKSYVMAGMFKLSSWISQACNQIHLSLLLSAN